MKSSDIDKLEDNQVCFNCIGEDYLKSLVKSGDVNKRCSYCGNVDSVISLRDLADHVGVAFKAHYSRTADSPDFFQRMMNEDKEIDYRWEREGEPVVYAIANAVEISENIAEDVRKLLEKKYFNFDEMLIGGEREFNSEAHYEEIDPEDHEWQKSWESFERTIKTEARFFSRAAISQLRELFDTVDKMATRHGKPLIVNVGPGTNYTQLYRARVFQADESLTAAMKRPDKELGAPSSRHAVSGRMNARGISVFYGATSIRTALAEVRPPVGSHVVVARFEIIRPIRLLDLTALGEVYEVGSIFNPDYVYRLGRMTFLRKLSDRIARPIMPDDQEREYLPTQAIADFLATECEVPLDGILFPSAQVGSDGLNVVLFHKASRCKEINIPEGTEIDTSTYMEYEGDVVPDFSVVEWVPSEEGPPPKERLNYDNREETLSVDFTSIAVHKVNSVDIDTSAYKVNRRRLVKDDLVPF